VGWKLRLLDGVLEQGKTLSVDQSGGAWVLCWIVAVKRGEAMIAVATSVPVHPKACNALGRMWRYPLRLCRFGTIITDVFRFIPSRKKT